MLTLFNLVRQLIRTLHSDGTPGQIAAGVALGAALGLTPIMNVHNALVIVLLVVLNVSFVAGLFAWGLFVPIGFLLDPVFDRLGRWLLIENQALRPLWGAWDDTPGIALTGFSNTIVLGSVAAWLALFLPIFFLARYGVIRYRATVAERARTWRIVQALQASKIYNVYRWFSP